MALVAKRVKAKDKIVKNHRTLAGILEGLKSQGKVIVLAHGCFDLLNPGHVRFLEDAKSRGDFLVVAIAEDKSATKIKGRGFPVNDVMDRLETVAGLTSVDYVTPFEGVTAEALIEKLQPSLFAKGTNFTERTVAERQAVKAEGARTVICGDKKAHSTRKVVQRIRRRKFE